MFTGHHFDLAAQIFFQIVGQTLGVGGFVVDDGNGLDLEIVNQKLGGGFGLIVVAAADPEHILVAPIRDLFIGGSRGEHHDLGVVENVGGRNGGG